MGRSFQSGESSVAETGLPTALFELQALVCDFDQKEMPDLRAELNLPLLTLSLVENGVVLQSATDRPPVGFLIVKDGALLFDPSFDSSPKTVDALRPSDFVSWIRAMFRTA
jgi:hypothetical protein